MEAEKPKIKVSAQSVTGESPLFAGPHMTERKWRHCLGSLLIKA